jgi:hypothetical protein
VRRVGWFIAGFGVAAVAAARYFMRPASAPVVTEEPPASRVVTEEPPASPVVTKERPVSPVVIEEPSEARADELRHRIAEARELVGERDEFEQAETPVDEADPEARRRSVHERGREAADRMRGEPS